MFKMMKFIFRHLLEVAVIVTSLHLVTADVYGIKGTNVSLPCYKLSKKQNWNPSSLLEVQIDSPKQTTRYCIFTESSKKGVCGNDEDSPRYNLTDDGNLTIYNVGLQDEGTYTCKMNNISLITNLTVYVAPSISVQKIVSPLRAGSGFVEAASCTASGGKPEASVKWMTDGPMKFNETLQEVVDADQSKGLSTVRKVLNVQPTKNYNGQSFFCEVKHPALENTEVRNLTLNVTYPPSPAQIFLTADKKRLICKSEGNPPPIFTWTMLSISPLPTMTGDTIDLISAQDPSRINDSYICVASNGISPDQTARMTTNEAVSVVATTSSQNVGAIVGGVIGGLLLLAFIGIIGFIVYRSVWIPKNKGPACKYSPPEQQTSSV